MTHKRSLPLIFLLLSPQAVRAKDAYVEGEVLVIFKQNIATAGATSALNKHSLRMAERYDSVSRHDHRVASLIREKTRSTAQLIATLQADPDVETVEPNYIRHVSVVTPNDTDYTKLWGLRNSGQTVNALGGSSGVDTKFQEAWRLARPVASEVVVGVVDTGVDITHPDLAANIWLNPGEIAGNGIDDDGDGYIDDIHGYDFEGLTAAITDSGYHGTHVAGTIAAVGKNSLGVIGLDYRAKILPLKVSIDGDTIDTSAAIAAYNYAITLKQKGINIVALNASFGGGSFSISEQNAITALKNAGIILCAAAGNESANNDTTPSYPANYTTTNIISVAALTQSNGLATFSNYGATTVDIAAPGKNIYSTMPVNNVTPVTSLKVANVTYASQELTYSGTTTASGISGTIYACGIGNPGEFPPGVSGNIALIQRGTLTFAEKVTNAMNAGATAAVIYDNTANALSVGGFTLGTAGNWIPALQVTQASGNAIIASPVKTSTVSNTRETTLAYQFLDGTSMATPHVAGAVAFAAMNFPADTMSQRMTRILSHVTLVPALTGKMTSGGRLDLLKIIDSDSDGLPDWWETEKFGNLAQTANADPDADGFTNVQEFLAGTSPQVTGSRLNFATYARGGLGSHDYILSFPSMENTIYRIQWSNNLATWSQLGSDVTGTGSAMQVIDPGALPAAPARYYRIGIPPQ
ncbi:MAG: S8 family serine peptidase [Luteolibacter sp.]